MRAIDLLGGTEFVCEADCWTLLATQSVGRLAVTVDGKVDIFPVNYALDGDGIVFGTNAGRKMSWASDGEVAFEVDWVDGASASGWSVVVHGTAQQVSRTDEGAPQSAVEQWAGKKDFLVRIAPGSVTGRRVGPRPKL